MTALLAGVALLLAGSGLLGTLLAVRGRAEGFNDQTLGLIMSGYFVGFFLGTYAAPNLIQRIGHIRAFAFYAALCAVTVLLHPMLVDPWIWGGLRVLTGIALVGLYTVIESWLNAQAPAAQRSQVFAVYMAVNLLALAAGQWLIGLYSPLLFVPFSLVAILICVAALPVTASRMLQPELPATPRLALVALYRAAPAAASGALLGGLALGGFWGLGAVYASRLGMDVTGIATLMSLTILGGAALQWPIGRLSDRGDRRTTLALVCTLATVVSVALALTGGSDRTLLYALFFAFGGLSFAIYPVCVAHLLDHLAAEDMLSGCSSLLLLNGIGSALGPALAGALMTQAGPQALPAFFAITLALLALVTGGRRLSYRREREHPAHFHPMLRTTPSALELLPETDAPDAPPAASATEVPSPARPSDRPREESQ
ncbi:MFS transporter [Lysobacter sp. D1-1-M9]|uniref:MFS transporter n=1 Tax=Novilysobacter longmucuonensis TaxID=3098603 RepID=UPI003983C5D0